MPLAIPEQSRKTLISPSMACYTAAVWRWSELSIHDTRHCWWSMHENKHNHLKWSPLSNSWSTSAGRSVSKSQTDFTFTSLMFLVKQPKYSTSTYPNTEPPQNKKTRWFNISLFLKRRGIPETFRKLQNQLFYWSDTAQTHSPSPGKREINFCI